MIIDSFSKLEEYALLRPGFAKAAAYLRSVDLQSLSEGRYEIDGEAVYMTVTEAALREEADAPLEAHDRYIDIQIVIAGTERYGWAPRASCRSRKGAYSPEKDIVFYGDRPSGLVTLEAGGMAVFFPSDAHAPLIGRGTVRKCIVKVRS